MAEKILVLKGQFLLYLWPIYHPFDYCLPQRVEQHECGNAEDTDGKTGICFNLEKKGACLIRGCKYIHMDRNASYPNYSNNLK